MSLRYYAFIDPFGAIVLAEKISCDTFYERAGVMIVTHAHRDHMKGLFKGIRKGVKIFASKPTKDLLMILANVNPYGIHGLLYGERVEFKEGSLWLEKASHILGAAQVIFEHRNGIRVVYTGDFRQPGTPIMETDILVMEATYGKPGMVRPSLEDVRKELVTLVKKLLKDGPVNIVAYHGKLQEAMEILRGDMPEVPFLAPRKVWLISNIAAKYGMKLGEIIPMESYEGIQIARGDWYIAFLHVGDRAPFKGTTIVLSGWNFGTIVRKIDPKRYVVALSGHADFRQLLAYVQEAQPKFVLVDGTRSIYANTFAKEIRRRLRIEAISMP